MPQVIPSPSDYTGFMVNRTALVAALLLALAAPSWANDALQDARGAANPNASWDGGCTGGSCGSQVSPADGRINDAVAGALNTNSLAVAPDRGPRPAMSAQVPTPKLGDDAEGAKDKPGFFSKLFSGKGLMYGLGGAAAGAGIGWLVGGPIGAVVGGLLGAIGGFFLSKMLAK